MRILGPLLLGFSLILAVCVCYRWDSYKNMKRTQEISEDDTDNIKGKKVRTQMYWRKERNSEDFKESVGEEETLNKNLVREDYREWSSDQYNVDREIPHYNDRPRRIRKGRLNFDIARVHGYKQKKLIRSQQRLI